jgi:purine-nucleoside phosphorylase
MDADVESRIDRAWTGLRPLLGGARPPVGVILGSGLGGFVDSVEGVEAPYSSIPGFPRPTVQGHSGRLKVGSTAAVMAGRFHHYEGHPIQDVVLPVLLLHRIGVRTLIVTNAAGGINRDYAPGDLVLIKDHLNLMGVTPLRGPNPSLGPRFPDMSAAYALELRDLARAASPAPLREGVYAAMQGPSYETPAEIRMLAAIGADLVGMSTVPEVIIAAYLGMRVLGISCVTNMAAGILARPLDHEEVMARGREAGPRFGSLLTGILDRLQRGGVEG